MSVPQEQWQWFGNVGHFICGFDCRFHLCTKVGAYLVSTVGQYFPDESVRESVAESRGIRLVGRGDDRKADYMRRIGFEEIGLNRTFETMVFLAGEPCAEVACGCGLPKISGESLAFAAYSDAGAATAGHMEICRRWAEQAIDGADALIAALEAKR